MEFMTVRELSKSPKDTLTKLAKDGKAVLTNNGKPQALIFKIDGEVLSGHYHFYRSLSSCKI